MTSDQAKQAARIIDAVFGGEDRISPQTIVDMFTTWSYILQSKESIRGEDE